MKGSTEIWSTHSLHEYVPKYNMEHCNKNGITVYESRKEL
jgi:hypothetical protein